MLPPVLELYIVWHPGDQKGSGIALEFVEHFHGTVFTGLIGGAVEVFVRSESWRRAEDAPRPIPSAKAPLPNGLELARFVALVPLMGTEMAATVESGASPWHSYIHEIARLQRESPRQVGVFPYQMDAGASDGTILGKLLEPYQRIAATPPDVAGETEATLRCRDLAQGITQLISDVEEKRLTVFISHTKPNRPGGEEDTDARI